MTRKSPYKHHVKKHIRRGRSVTDYDRGKGKQPKQPQVGKKPTLSYKQSSSNFIVNIRYTSITAERIPVHAVNAAQAIEQAMIMRRNIEEPLKVEATRN